MSHSLPDILAWIEPHAVLLALVLPSVSRIVGHLVPEELVMIVIGILCAHTTGPQALVLVAALFIGHFIGDQAMFTLGSVLGRHAERWPGISRRVGRVVDRLESSPWGLWALIPARVLPLCRGLWLAACGVIGVSRRRFILVDGVALGAHLTVWCGLGWLLGERASVVADYGRPVAVWFVVAVLCGVASVWVWRRIPTIEPLRERVRRSFR